MAGAPDPDYEALCARLRTWTGIPVTDYKANYLRRRLDARRRASGAPDWAAFGRLLETDLDERRRLIDRLTVHVTECFRDGDVWRALEADVVPALLESALRSGRILQAWCAGCSTGEEAYSLAALFASAGADAGRPPGSGVRILATDVDPGVVEKAAAGQLPRGSLDKAPPRHRRWFVDGPEGPSPGRELRRMVRFDRHDMLRDPAPAGLHLVLCRNVMIYFDRTAQERLLEAFHGALLPGGYLVTGKTETVLSHGRGRFRCVAAAERIFQRTEAGP